MTKISFKDKNTAVTGLSLKLRLLSLALVAARNRVIPIEMIKKVKVVMVLLSQPLLHTQKRTFILRLRRIKDTNSIYKKKIYI